MIQSATSRSQSVQRRNRRSVRPFIELLEDRMMLSILDLTGGFLDYDGSAGANTLAVALVGSNYRFTDSENITVAGAQAGKCTGSGGMMVLCATDAVNSVDIDLLGGGDTANLGGLSLTGDLTVASDAIGVDSPLTSGGTTTFNAFGAITDNNAADPDISSVTCQFSAITGIGKVTDANPTLEVNCTNLGATNTGAGGISISDTAGGVAISLVDAAAGDVTLTAMNGSLTESTSDPAADVVGGTVTLAVTGAASEIGVPGPFGGPSDPLEVDAATLLNASSVDGNIAIANTDGVLPLGALDAGAGMILLTAINGAITDGNGGAGASNLSAAGGVNLTTTLVIAWTPGARGDGIPTTTGDAIGTLALPIRTTIGSLSATTEDGGLFVSDDNAAGLIVNNVLVREDGFTPFIGSSNTVVINSGAPHAGVHDISITAVRDVVLNSATAPDGVSIRSKSGMIVDMNQAATDVLARSLSLAADGTIGLETDPIEFQVESFNASTANGSIYLTERLIGTAATVVANGAGNDVVVASTATNFRLGIVSAPDMVTASADGGTLTDGNGGAVNVTAQTVTLLGKAGIGSAGDPVDTAATSLVATAQDLAAPIHVSEADGLDSVSARTNNGNVTITYLGGPLTFVASKDVLNASGAAVSFETTTGDVAVGVVDAGSSDVSIKAAAAIRDDVNDAVVDIRGGTVTLTAVTGIGTSGNEIDTNADEITATTTAGDVHIREADALTLSASSSGSNLDVRTAAGDLTLLIVSASGQVRLEAGGAIVDGNAATTNVTAGTLILVASSRIGTSGDPLETAANTLSADAGGGLALANSKSLTLTTATATGGPVAISVLGSLTLGSVTAKGRTATVTATQTITDGNGPALNIAAQDLVLQGTAVGTAGDKIETDASSIMATSTSGGLYLSDLGVGTLTLTATASGSLADLDIESARSIVLDVANAKGDTVKLRAAGSITDGNDTPTTTPTNVTAKNLNIAAPGGLGTATNPLETAVDQVIMADGGAGGGSFTNAGALAITEAALEPPGAGVLTFEAESITVLDIADDVATVTPGRSVVLRTAVGHIVFIDPNDTIETSGIGAITMEAGTVVGSGAVAVLGNLKTAGGKIVVTADRTITIGLLNAAAGSVTVTARAGVIVDGNGAATNVIAGTPSLTGLVPTARASELDEITAVANAAAARAEAAAKQSSADAFNAGFMIMTAAQIAARIDLENKEEAADAAEDESADADVAAARAHWASVTVAATAFQEAFLLAQATAEKAAIARDAAARVRDQATLARDQNNAVGSPTDPLTVQAGVLNLDAGSSDIFLDIVGPITLGNVSTSGPDAQIEINATGDITIQGTVTSATSVRLDSGGAIIDMGGTIVAPDFIATAAMGIGTTGPIAAMVTRLAADGGAGGVNIMNTGDVQIATIEGVAGVSAAAGGVMITVASDLVLAALVNAPGQTIMFSASESILDGNGNANNIVADALELMAGTGTGTNADAIETQINSFAADGGTGGVFLDNTGDLTLEPVGAQSLLTASRGSLVVSTTGDLDIADGFVQGDGLTVGLTATGGSIQEAAPGGPAVDIVGATVNLTVGGGAGSTIGAALATLLIRVTTLNAATDGGSIFLQDASGGVAVGLVDAASGDVNLTTLGGSITESGSDAAADIVGDTLNLTVTGGASTVGTLAQTLEIDAVTLNAATAGGSVFLHDTDGGVAAGLVDAGTGTVDLSASGAISDGNADANNVTATTLTIGASGGIGDGDALETEISTLNATNTGGGDIAIDNNGASAGALDIAGVSNAGGGDITIDNVGAITVTGAVTATGAGADITITAASPVTISADLIAAGDIIVEAGETAGAGDDLVVDSGATIQSTGGSVTLRADDGILIEAGTTVQSDTGSVDVIGDFNNAGAVGSVVSVLGAVHGSPVNVTGANPPPVILSVQNSSPSCGGAKQGQSVSISAGFTHIGAEIHTATIDWGDGTVTAGLITEPAAGSLGAIAANHVYSTGGLYTITVQVTDASNGADSRTMRAMIAGAGIHGGVLQIIGDHNNNSIAVTRLGTTQYRVRANVIPGGASIFNTVDVRKILGVLCNGADRMTVASSITIRTLLDGGPGNDTLSGGSGPNILIGAEDDDSLRGGTGRDLIIGGQGKDRLNGNGDDDILIAGASAFDSDHSALDMVLDEWLSDRDYATRVRNLNGTGMGDRLNGSYFLQRNTIYDQDPLELVLGFSGTDWFLCDASEARDRLATTETLS